MIISQEILKRTTNFVNQDIFLNYRNSKYYCTFKEILRRDSFIQGRGTYMGNIVPGYSRITP